MSSTRLPVVAASLALLAASPAAAKPVRLLPAAPAWFYADTADTVSTIDEDGLWGGIPVWRTGAVLLETTSPAATLDVQRLPAVLSARVLDNEGTLLWVDLGAQADEAAWSRRIRARPDVRWAHPDLAFELEAHALPDDPFAADLWHLENDGSYRGVADADIDAEGAWTVATGAGTVVATIDSGVDISHPDLDATCGYNYVEDTADCYPADDNAHGTAAAGLSAAIGNNGVGVAGVAYDASVYGVRLLGGATSMSDVYNSFKESVDAGAAALNNSWGYGDCPSYELPATFRRALEYAEYDGRGGLGAVVVFSAGNDNCDISVEGLLTHPFVFSIAALAPTDVRMSYSSWGEGLDVAAPADPTVTTDIFGSKGYGNHRGDNGYTSSFGGTSAAAPVVSGVVALMVEANPAITAAEIRDVLRATADKVSLTDADYDATGWSTHYGYGRINAAAAVLAVANQGPTAPTATGPVGDPYADRVVLQWSAGSDPDGDSLTYTIDLTISRPIEDETDTGDTEVRYTNTTDVIGGVSTLTYDVTERVQAGDVVTWTVRAADAWTESDPTEDSSFTVVAVPEAPEPEPEPEDTATDAVDTAAPVVSLTDGASAQPGDKGGCSTLAGAPASSGMIAFLLGVLGLRRRRSHQ